MSDLIQRFEECGFHSERRKAFERKSAAKALATDLARTFAPESIPEFKKPAYQHAVMDQDIQIHVGPYDKTLAVQCEYVETAPRAKRAAVEIRRVWLGNYDITGYFNDSQLQELEETIETVLLDR